MAKYVHALVLAAGLSRRMGTPKQLLPFGKTTILQAVVDSLLEADLDGICVVVGHRAEEIQESLRERPVRYCFNDNYRDGMFSSVLCGIQALTDVADAVLIVLGDQPQIESQIVREVVAAYRSGDRGIVVPVCNGRRGHPALVDLKKYGGEIRGLSGDQGLKPVMRGHPEDTLEVPVEEDGILRDLDTPEEYRAEIEKAKDKRIEN
ncbi:MAG: nucleotidyltransferase family protein [bacterium]|nr:nucleotidyltransferase family protein [bacterium]